MKIIDFKDRTTPKTPPELVKALRRILRAARENKLQYIAVAFRTEEEGDEESYAGEVAAWERDDDLPSLIGQVVLMQIEIAEMCYTVEEE